MKNIIVTGGAGFIGSHLVLRLLAQGHRVLNIDQLGYASSTDYFAGADPKKYSFLKSDICHYDRMLQAFETFCPNAIFHLAAESHVDRSIHSSDAFIHSNIEGTHSLLKAARAYLESHPHPEFRFLHVSTDEVYGSLGLKDAPFTERSPYQPNSPYAASKAASDHLARAWFQTHRLPVIITHCSNNYGPHQFPEKLIPLMIANCRSNKNLPVYGKGQNIRDWLHVSDHVEGLIAAWQNGQVGLTYNLGGGYEIENIKIVELICHIMDEMCPREDGQMYNQLITYVTDRKGHDFRYAIDSSFAQTELRWRPKVDFHVGLRATIAWSLNAK